MATSKSPTSTRRSPLTANGGVSLIPNSSPHENFKIVRNKNGEPAVSRASPPPEALTDWATPGAAEISGGSTKLSWEGPSAARASRDGAAAGAHGAEDGAWACRPDGDERGGERSSGEEEEEDIDELFRVEMDQMARERGAAAGCLPRPVSLPAALDQTSGHALGRAGNGSTPSAPRPLPLPSPLSSLRAWSLHAYRCTRQSLAERLGRAPPSANPALASRAAAVREAGEQCARLAGVAAAMATHLGAVSRTQRDLGRACLSLAVESEGGALGNEWLRNAEANNALHRNGTTLVDALNRFVAGIDTLCSKTIDDTLRAVQRCEAARLEYDAYRSALSSFPVTEADQRELDQRRAAFEKLRQNCEVKLQLVDGNRVSVLRRQLILFREALNAYFSGNRAALEAAMKPFGGSVFTKPVQTGSP